MRRDISIIYFGNEQIYLGKEQNFKTRIRPHLSLVTDGNELVKWGTSWDPLQPRLSKSGLYFKLKGNSKIGTRKIAIKIEGFYSRTFVESI